MLRRLLLTFTLVFLFGLGQQGAAMHAISHLADSQVPTHQQDKQAPHTPVCDKCVVYAELGSAVDSAHVFPGLAADHEAIAAATTPPRYTRYTSHYTARAPPYLA